MVLPKLFVSFVFLFAILVGQNINGVRASSRLKMWSRKVKENTFQPEKLFVFGDSYVDTGNSGFDAPSWNTPYGMTNPGQPAGRYSDGCLLTDYVAKYFGLRTPPAYRFVNPNIPQMLQYGVNFAYGGTGVFDTDIPNPNMTVQISYLKQYVEDGVFTLNDLNNSLSVLSVTGNDYATRLHHNGAIDETFIRSVVDQIKEDMRSLCELGAKTIAVTAMPPQGCTPIFAESPNQCNETVNGVVLFHNVLLYIAVFELNTSGNCSNHILHLYSAFETAFHSGVFPTPYQACCVGINSTYTCGDVDVLGQPMYTVCSDPNSAFYWDMAHPTQAAWNATYELALNDSFGQINYSLEQ